MCQVVEEKGELIVNSDVDGGAEVTQGEIHQVKSIPRKNLNVNEAQQQRKLTSLLVTDLDQKLEKVVDCALEYRDVFSLEDHHVWNISLKHLIILQFDNHLVVYPLLFVIKSPEW